MRIHVPAGLSRLHFAAQTSHNKESESSKGPKQQRRSTGATAWTLCSMNFNTNKVHPIVHMSNKCLNSSKLAVSRL